MPKVYHKQQATQVIQYTDITGTRKKSPPMPTSQAIAKVKQLRHERLARCWTSISYSNPDSNAKSLPEAADFEGDISSLCSAAKAVKVGGA